MKSKQGQYPAGSSGKKDVREIPIEDIERNDALQPREKTNDDIVSEYAEAMIQGADFPEVIVFYDGRKYWLADGYHRYAAATKIGKKKIKAEVRKGSERDALLCSVGANAAHGLRRTNADKKRAATTLLKDPVWSTWSNAAIAKQCGVCDTFVGDIRKEVSPVGPTIRTCIRNGKPMQMKTPTFANRKKTDDVAAQVAPVIPAIPEPEPTTSTPEALNGIQSTTLPGALDGEVAAAKDAERPANIARENTVVSSSTVVLDVVKESDMTAHNDRVPEASVASKSKSTFKVFNAFRDKIHLNCLIQVDSFDVAKERADAFHQDVLKAAKARCIEVREEGSSFNLDDLPSI